MAAVTHATGTGPATPRPAARADLRGRALGRLPERVRAAIAEQQDHSERLIGWIQLVVVVLFGTLYLLAPKPFTAEQTFAPVPWVLGLYFGFTLLRLGLAYRMRLPGWLIVLSIFLDMALLIALIWSFHLQYRQPASFYLKAPTLLYVFIFIALRTLRFEVRYVLLAGAVAALGWLGLLGYAVHDTHHMKITRDYVEYMTSNAMLIGAEFKDRLDPGGHRHFGAGDRAGAAADGASDGRAVGGARPGAVLRPRDRRPHPRIRARAAPRLRRGARSRDPQRRHPRLLGPGQVAGAGGGDAPVDRIRGAAGAGDPALRRLHRQVPGRRDHGHVRRRGAQPHLRRRRAQRHRRAAG